MTAEKLQATETAYQIAQQVADQKRQNRNEAVLQALKSGMTQSQIARATGLTRGRIAQIVHPNLRGET